MLALLVLCVSVVASLLLSHLPHMPHAVTSEGKKAPAAKLFVPEYRHSSRSKSLYHTAATKPNHEAKAVSPVHPAASTIRAGFYVNWDLQSWQSLKAHHQDMNMVLPEWFFLSDTGQNIRVEIDEKALTLLKQQGKPVIPMLSNYTEKGWDGELVSQIISQPERRYLLIQRVLQLVKQHHFQGINIDFEDMASLQSDEDFVSFAQELYRAFHADKLLVTMDVAPFNEDYPYRRLAPYLDYVFLMAYDLHNASSNEGMIAPHHWVEQALSSVTEAIPSQKIILCLAAYGYDWPKGKEGTDITYAEALATAKESEATIEYDNDEYNLKYMYYDDNDEKHYVYFTDAATTYNALSTATSFGTAGVALWRLGSEDPRVWSFYDSKPSTNWQNQFHQVSFAHQIDYIGEGELLDVLATPQVGQVSYSFDPKENLVTEERYKTLPSGFVIRKFGKLDKHVILTFDDGPDEEYTPQILDILKQYKVPATFFMLGINIENNLPLVRRISREGFEIGNHSFTHPNLAEVDKDRALLEISATRRLIEWVTGKSTLLFRPPYNADAEPTTMAELIPVALSRQENFYTVGESIDPEDWQQGITPETILHRVKSEFAGGRGNIVLLHDAGGDRSATVKALPAIIQFYKNQGYSFTTVSALMGKTTAEIMPPVRDSGMDYYLDRASFYAVLLLYFGSKFLYWTFYIAIVLGIIRLLFLIYLRYKRQSQIPNLPSAATTHYRPTVAIVVPAYNEEITICATIQSLLHIDYPHCQIIVVDDGSKDQTSLVAKNSFGHLPQVSILTKTNGGKADALNHGILHTQAEIIVCIDADTRLATDAVSQLITPFSSPDVGAVAGNVKVGNPVNGLTRFQSLEYITAQNFEREAFAYINAVTVIPGAIGAFRREALNQIGGFSSDTLAEDCDLTLRLIEAGYRIETNRRAKAYTEAPETFEAFIKQRKRWAFGVLQCFWKHKNLGHSALPLRQMRLVSIPHLLIFQFVLPLFTPIAEFLMLLALISGHWEKVALFYASFLAIEWVTGLLALHWDNEPLSLSWSLPIQRQFLRWVNFYLLLAAYTRAFRGQIQSWGTLHRSGKFVSPKMTQPLP